MNFTKILSKPKPETICLSIVLILSNILSFRKLGNHPLFEWDESQGEGEQDLFTYFDWYSQKIGWIDHKDMKSFTEDSPGILFGKGDDHLNYYLLTHPKMKHQEEGDYWLVYH